jgi:hypothetical protein
LNLEPKVQVLALIDQAIKSFSPRHCTTQLPPAQEGKLCLWAKAAKRAAQTSGKKRKKYTRHHKTIRNSCVQNCCACSTLIQRCLLDLVELTKDLCLTKTVLNLSLHNTKFGPLFPRVAWEVEVYANLNDIQAILPWLKAFVSHFHLAWEGSLIWVWHILGPISGMWEELEDHSAYSFLDGGNDTTYATSWPISLLHFHNVRKWKEIYDII